MLKQILAACTAGLAAVTVATAGGATQLSEDQQGDSDKVQSSVLDSGSVSGVQTETEGFWGAVQFAFPEEPGDFGDNFATGVGGVAGFDHRLRPGLWFLTSLSYTRFQSQEDTDRIGLFAASMDLKWTPVGSKRILRPYLVAGIGMALMWRRQDDVVDHTLDGIYPDRWKLRGRESWCYNYGVGIERQLTGKVSIFAQVGSIVVPNIDDNLTDNPRMRLTSLLLGFQIATKQRMKTAMGSDPEQRIDDKKYHGDTDSHSAVNVYGGMGACATNGGSPRSRKFGANVSVGVGRDLSRLSEVVLKGTFMSFGGGPKVPALGLYLKMNLRKRHHKSWVYILAGGGGLAARTYRTTTSYYLGTGVGGVIKVEDTRKLNLELQWMVPTSGGSQTSPYVLLTIGVAI